jgi:hypothetical protein
MIKLFKILFETGPSAQSAIPTLGDDRRRVSRTGAAAEEEGYLDIVDTMDLDIDNPKDDNTFPEEDSIGSKITP